MNRNFGKGQLMQADRLQRRLQISGTVLLLGLAVEACSLLGKGRLRL